MEIGILHPGQMGVSVAASLQQSGHRVHWLPQGRSAQSQQRSVDQGLLPADSLEALCRDCAMLISVCPPHAAEDVAAQVAGAGFQGIYVDANAIAPAGVGRIGELLQAGGAQVVDGGIIGGPAWEPGTTLYLSGAQAHTVSELFKKGPLAVSVLDTGIGTASALKMCYAAYSKGSTALLAAVLAAADGLGVRASLEAQWSQDDPAWVAAAHARTRRVTTKAWRFAGEMAEIAATLEAAGLPPGFHLAAEELYQRMAHFKEAGQPPALDEVLASLLRV